MFFYVTFIPLLISGPTVHSWGWRQRWFWRPKCYTIGRHYSSCVKMTILPILYYMLFFQCMLGCWVFILGILNSWYFLIVLPNQWKLWNLINRKNGEEFWNWACFALIRVLGRLIDWFRKSFAFIYKNR